MSPILLPMVICGLGIVFSMVGTWFVTIKDDKSNVQNALNLGNWASMALTVIASYLLVKYMLPETLSLRGHAFTQWVFLVQSCRLVVVGAIMSIVTEYYTAMGKTSSNVYYSSIFYRSCY
jgi:K(+)-stimulated pyrophosphate-energized sodium pump